jgi:hypothetical protein
MSKNLTFRHAHGLVALAYFRPQTRPHFDTMYPISKAHLISGVKSSRSSPSYSLKDIHRQISFQRAAPLCWGVKTSLSRLELKSRSTDEIQDGAIPNSTLESVKTSLWTFPSGRTGNETHRVESRRKKLTFRYPVVSGARLRSKNPRRRRGASKAHFVIWRYDLDPMAGSST